jgi:hypothetical protein
MPVTIGVNLIETTQSVPAARLKPQLLVCVKSPEIVMPEIGGSALPVFAILMVFGERVVPTFSRPKPIFIAERLTTSAP